MHKNNSVRQLFCRLIFCLCLVSLVGCEFEKTPDKPTTKLYSKLFVSAGNATSATETEDGAPVVVWQRQFGAGTAYFHYINAIAPTADGGCVVVGLYQFALDEMTSVAVRLDASGEIRWRQPLSNVRNVAEAAIMMPDDSVVIAGTTSRSYMKTRTDAWITRIDASGAVVWDKVFDATQASDGFYDLALMTSGDIAAVGKYGEGRTFFEYPWLVIVDGAGNLKHDIKVDSVAGNEAFVFTGVYYDARNNRLIARGENKVSDFSAMKGISCQIPLESLIPSVAIDERFIATHFSRGKSVFAWGNYKADDNKTTHPFICRADAPYTDAVIISDTTVAADVLASFVPLPEGGGVGVIADAVSVTGNMLARINDAGHILWKAKSPFLTIRKIALATTGDVFAVGAREVGPSNLVREYWVTRLRIR